MNNLGLQRIFQKNKKTTERFALTENSHSGFTRLQNVLPEEKLCQKVVDTTL